MKRLCLAAMILLFAALDAWPCTCADSSPTACAGLDPKRIIFVGTLTYIENPPPEEFGPNVDASGLSRYRFRVDEKISGIGNAEIDVYSGRGGADCSYHFRQGEQYLVFPYRDEDGRLQATICSDTRRIDYAGALLPQLRAMRDHQPVASLFGILRRSQRPYDSVWDKSQEQPLPDTIVQLQGEGISFQTKTGEGGVYAFYNIPAGMYRLSAVLPLHLEVAETVLSDPPPPVELPGGTCFEHNAYAMPTGRIRGRVLDPNGEPLRSAGVNLYRVEKYEESEYPWWEGQRDKGFFEFDRLAPGRYVIVYNRLNQLDPDSPYPRTFYPGAPDLKSAAVIELVEGEQFLNADIHVAGAFPNRQLIVRILWKSGEQESDEVVVTAEGDRGARAFGRKLAPGVYHLTLLKDVRYAVYAREDCGLGARDVETRPVFVDGSDDGVSEVTLVFLGHGCPR